jgi:hypothetical protein
VHYEESFCTTARPPAHARAMSGEKQYCGRKQSAEVHETQMGTITHSYSKIASDGSLVCVDKFREVRENHGTRSARDKNEEEPVTTLVTS